MPKIAIESITYSNRARKQLGDVAALAASMASIGLLHPIVLSREHRLIAGARRIAAAKLNGWKEIDYTIPVSVHDLHDALKAERDENTCREPFLPTEAVAIAEQIEAMEREEAAARQAVGRPKAGEKITPGKLPGPTETPENAVSDEKGRAKSRSAEVVGMGRKTLDKAQKVTAAAKADPAKFGDLPETMDATGKVDPAFKEMKRRQARQSATESLDQEGCSDLVQVEPWEEIAKETKLIIAELRAVATHMRSAFKIVDGQITHPGATRFTRMGTVGQVLEIVRYLESNTPVGADGEKIITARDEEKNAALAKGAA